MQLQVRPDADCFERREVQPDLWWSQLDDPDGMGKQPRWRLRPDPGWSVLHQLTFSSLKGRPQHRTAFLCSKSELPTGDRSSMKINFFQRLFPVLAILTVYATAQEPVKPELCPRIITATRQVTIFSSLEKQLLQNVQKKDLASIQALLSDELLIFMPNADAMPGEDWVGSVLSKDF